MSRPIAADVRLCVCLSHLDLATRKWTRAFGGGGGGGGDGGGVEEGEGHGPPNDGRVALFTVASAEPAAMAPAGGLHAVLAVLWFLPAKIEKPTVSRPREARSSPPERFWGVEHGSAL